MLFHRSDNFGVDQSTSPTSKLFDRNVTAN